MPVGDFSPDTDDSDTFQNERPAHPVKLDGIVLDEHDVARAELALRSLIGR